MRKLRVTTESWPLRQRFTISRADPLLSARVVLVEIEQDGVIGRGECEGPPLAGSGSVSAIEAVRTSIASGATRHDIQDAMSAGGGRNALDCALIDLEAKRSKRSVTEILGLDALRSVETVYTISLESAEEMHRLAAARSDHGTLKIKLGRESGDVERVAAVRSAAPNARISVDANTSWSRAQLIELMPALQKLGVELIEQPFPPGQDHLLDGIDRIIPIAADESCLTRQSLPELVGRYDYINIKLDKAGGLTEALLLAEAAREQGFRIMVGCNLGTSLAMAPAMVVAQQADFVDLDGVLLLTEDRADGLTYRGGTIEPPIPALWG